MSAGGDSPYLKPAPLTFLKAAAEAALASGETVGKYHHRAVIHALDETWADAYSEGRAARAVDVERLVRAWHRADCSAIMPALHEAGDPDAYCTLQAANVAREYEAER